MNCTEFELAVQERLDARRTELPPDLHPHLALCASCRSFWAAQLTLVSLTKSWPAGLQSSRPMETVLAELAPVPAANSMPNIAAKPASRGRERAVVGVSGIACATLAMVGLMISLVRLTPPEPQHQIVSTQGSAPAEPTLVAQTISGLWQGVSTEYAELSQKSSRVLEDWRDLPDSIALPELPLDESPATDRSPTWLRLDRPVSDRVGQAFDFLWDALPRTSPQSS